MKKENETENHGMVEESFPLGVTFYPGSSDTLQTTRFYASFSDGIAIPNQDEWLALCEKLERGRNELAGYLCRIKLPLPISFLSRLTDLFPGQNVRMKDVDGFLCIFEKPPSHE